MEPLEPKPPEPLPTNVEEIRGKLYEKLHQYPPEEYEEYAALVEETRNRTFRLARLRGETLDRAKELAYMAALFLLNRWLPEVFTINLD